MTLEDQVVIALRRINQAIHVWSRSLLHDYGLTSPQLATLRELVASDESTTGALTAALHLSQPTVTGILTRLQARGLVRRERSTTDRRCVRILVTDAGRELAARSPMLLRDRFREKLALLSAAQQTDMLAMLQQVAEMMHAPDVSEGPFFYVD
jgi:DNA-binding MarR family transcriptional regulator